MKRKLLLSILFIGLIGCSSTGSETSSMTSSTSSISSESSSIEVSSSSSDNTSSVDSSSLDSSMSSSTSISSEVSSDSSSSSSSVATPTVMSVQEALEEGESLENETTGTLVKLTVTYLRTLTWSRSNEDVMILADNTGSIGLWVTYSDYSNYLAKRYINQDYVVTANIVKQNNQVRLNLNDSYSVEQSFVNYSETPSVDLTLVSEQKNSISEIVTDFENIPLNNKKYGYGKIVTFTAQLVATEYENSGKKALFYDGTNTLTAVSSSKIAEQTDIANYYQVTGILSVEVTSPALYFLEKKLVSSDDTITLDKVTTTTAASFKKYSILQDNYNSPTYAEYLSLYKTTGYITYDTGRNSYNLGIVDAFGGSLNDVGGNLISGLFLLNNQNMDERDVTYSPFYDYINAQIEITIYYSLNQFDSSNHGWKIFALESIVPSLEVV